PFFLSRFHVRGTYSVGDERSRRHAAAVDLTGLPEQICASGVPGWALPQAQKSRSSVQSPHPRTGVTALILQRNGPVLPDDPVRPRMRAYLAAVLVVAATAALAVVCGAQAFSAQSRPFPGFLMYSNGAVTSLMRRDWQGPAVGLLPRDVVRAVDD